MTSFDYAASADPIRDDLAAAHRRQWERTANPGVWLSGEQRVAVARETRLARDCALCRERKQALSPFAVEGEHDHGRSLPAPMVDEIHRVTTDAARLSQTWYESLLEQGISADEYVEALGVAVCTISIDAFHDALGLPLEPLPEPRPGEPRRERPHDLVEGEAWVPIREEKAVGAELGLPANKAPYVLRALSLVPPEVVAWHDLSAAQYLGRDEMMSFKQVRAIDRSQIELVAGRVSALNECFY